MGMEMELDFDKICMFDLSPDTILPTHRPRIEERNPDGEPPCKANLLSVKEFGDVAFDCYHSASCKSTPSQGIDDLSQVFLYRRSQDARKTNRGEGGERQKIEIPRHTGMSFSSGILDVLCSSDEEGLQKGSAVKCFDFAEPCLPDCSIDISLDSKDRKKQPAKIIARDLAGDVTSGCHQIVSPQTDSNELLEGDVDFLLQKLFSVKLECPHLPSPSESDCSSKASLKAQFGPIRQMFHPFMKSKSPRTSFGYATDPSEVKTLGIENTRRNKTSRKSMLGNFSSIAQSLVSDYQLPKKDHQDFVAASSPVHLHGCLKLQNEDGVPYFEFSLKCLKDCFVAKTWRSDSACNWAYTFHTINNRKRCNSSRQEISMVAQMQVFGYLSSEIREGGAFNNAMVREFVLYDVAHARKHAAAQEHLSGSPNVRTPSKSSSPGLSKGIKDQDHTYEPVKLSSRTQHNSGKGNFEPVELHPGLEIAAVTIQVPFEKRENLKYRGENMHGDKEYPDLLNLAVAGRSTPELSHCNNLSNVNVIIPSGHHGVPRAEHWGPSSLLDRWRFGGGCDCGGWDMGCPLTVLNNSFVNCSEGDPLQKPFKMLFQGAKQDTPALTLTAVKEGEYTVDFHAQLSTLQAFAVCVAVLHATEAFVSTPRGAKVQPLPTNSLKSLLEKEARSLIEAAGKEKKVTVKAKNILPSFAHPPFSPLARV